MIPRHLSGQGAEGLLRVRGPGARPSHHSQIGADGQGPAGDRSASLIVSGRVAATSDPWGDQQKGSRILPSQGRHLPR